MRNLKLFLAALVLLTSCKEDEIQVIEQPPQSQENPQLLVEQLPQSVKTAIQGEMPRNVFDLLEKKVSQVTASDGTNTYAIAVKKGVTLQDFLSNPRAAALKKLLQEDCSEQPKWSDSTFSTLIINEKDGSLGNPTYVKAINHDHYIETNFTNLITHETITTFTPNPYPSTRDRGNNHHYSGYKGETGSFLGNIWTGFKDFLGNTKNTFGNIFKKCKCGSSTYRLEITHSQAYSDHKMHSCCNDIEQDLSSNFEFVMPLSFLKTPISMENLTEKECECAVSTAREILETPQGNYLVSSSDRAALECACLQNNALAYAKALDLDTADALFLYANPVLYSQICSFLKEQHYSPSALSFSKKAIQAVREGGEVDFPNRIIDRITDKRIQCVHNKLRNGNNDYVKQILEQFEGENSDFHIEISSVPKITEEKYNGRTIYYYGINTIKIEINEKILSGGDITIAAIILHEYVHAELFRIENTKKEKNNDFWKLYGEYLGLDDADYNHHYIISQHYIPIMKNALEKFHKEQLPEDYNMRIKHLNNKIQDDFYTMLAWHGVKEKSIITEDVYNQLSNKEDIEKAQVILKFVGQNCKNQ